MTEFLSSLRAPEPLPILNPSNFVPKNGFPVVKALTQNRRKHLIILCFFALIIVMYLGPMRLFFDPVVRAVLFSFPELVFLGAGLSSQLWRNLRKNNGWCMLYRKTRQIPVVVTSLTRGQPNHCKKLRNLWPQKCPPPLPPAVG